MLVTVRNTKSGKMSLKDLPVGGIAEVIEGYGEIKIGYLFIMDTQGLTLLNDLTLLSSISNEEWLKYLQNIQIRLLDYSQVVELRSKPINIT